MLSHELRNPLAPIRNALEVIRRVAPPDPKLSWATDVTGRQVQHLTRLVEELLDVAASARARSCCRPRCSICAGHLDGARDRAVGARVAVPPVTYRLPDHAARVRGDAARLVQVVPNLLHNARPSTPNRAGTASTCN